MKMLGDRRITRVCVAVSVVLAAGLAAAKGNSFFKLNLLAGSANGGLVKEAEILRQDFSKIGIDLDVQFVDFATIGPRYKLTAQTGKTYEQGGYDIYFSGTSLDTFPDPTGIYDRYASDQFYPNGNNRTRYANSEFDELIYKALATPNDQERWAITRKAIALLRQDFACIPIVRAPRTNLVRTDIKFPENKGYYGWTAYAVRWARREIDGKSPDDMTPREKTLVIATSGSGLEAFLPGFHDNYNTQVALDWMAYDALLAPVEGAYVNKGKGGKIGPKPALARSWDISEDGKSWTFHLVPNAKWHDGKTVTADDVVFTYNLIKNPEAGYGLYRKFIKNSRVTWKKIDDQTVQFSSQKYNPVLPVMFADTPIVPKHVLKDIPPAQLKTSRYNTSTVIGSGPFTLDVYNPGEFIRWKANEDYYGGRPFFDYVVFRTMPQKTAAFYAIKAGEADITKRYVFTRELEEIKANPAIYTVAQPDISMGIIRINHVHPQLSKLGVRKAISLATNRQAIVDVVYDGWGRPANQLVPSWNPAYSPDLPDLKYDLNEAKKAMEEAGFDYSTISIDGPK